MNHSQFQRKTTGGYYTPSYVVDYMVQKIFSHLISSKRVNTGSYKKFEKSLSQLSFCDLSLGTGNFVIGILKWIWREFKNYPDISIEAKKIFFQTFVRNNLFGVELDKQILELCKSEIIKNYVFLKSTDFRNFWNGNSIVDLDAKRILKEKAVKLKPFSWGNKFDVIIGNPPYYNIKKMGLQDPNTRLLFEYLKDSDKWKKYFRSSSDIYYYFIIQALHLLQKDGLLSFIIPNYWIDNKYADLLREILLKSQILEIVNLGEINIFRDEGRWLKISTCILTSEKKEPYQDINVTKIKTRNFSKMIKQPKLISKNKSFRVAQSNLGKEKWILSPYLSILQKIFSNKELVPLSSIGRVAQGMSPGVKDVFVLTDEKVNRNQIEKEVLVPFITNGNMNKWKPKIEQKLFAILPSRIKNLDDFSETKKYLMSNKEKLSAGPDRQRLLKLEKIRWFDFSVYRNMSVYENVKQKILCPYRALNPKFCYDNIGYFGATDIYSIIPKNEDDIYSLLGILNSSTFNFYYREAGKIKGKMLEFFSDPMKKIPIPSVDERTSLVAPVKEILGCLKKNENNNRQELTYLESIIEERITKMYKLDPEFIKKYTSHGK